MTLKKNDNTAQYTTHCTAVWTVVYLNFNVMGVKSIHRYAVVDVADLIY
jgi:hypothetical protein